MADLRPIAVMDTGVGGLSVVNVLHALAPREEIHYFADTAHLPYGIKSPELIKKLALNMAQTLVKKTNPKVLVVACHTISVWYLEELAKHLGIPVIGMVKPSLKGLKPIVSDHSFKSFGILSTKATVTSGVYRMGWPLVDAKVELRLCEHACGPLVSLVEEGQLSEEDLVIIADRLLPDDLKKCDGLLIGCTHFSVLKPVFKRIFKPSCLLIDAADLVVAELLSMLEAENALSARDPIDSVKVYVSDNPERFLKIAQGFISCPLDLELVRI